MTERRAHMDDATTRWAARTHLRDSVPGGKLQALPVLALWLLAAGTAFGLSLAAIHRYHAGTGDWPFDMAFFHNLIHNAAFGGAFRQTSSTHEWNGLLNLTHAFFLLPAFVPFYRVLPRMETLLVLQSIALASGIFPVAALARLHGARSWTGVLAAACYATSFALWRLGLADFRPLLLSIPALLWLALALQRPSNLLWTLVAAVTACAVREEMPLLVAALATTTTLTSRTPRRTGGIVVLVALAWFGLQAWLRPRAGFYITFDRPVDLAASARWVATTAGEWNRQWKCVSDYLHPGFWPALLDPVVLVGALPLLFYQFLLSPYEWWTWQGPYVHHLAPFLAFVSAAGASGWGRIERWRHALLPRRPWVVPILMAAALALQIPRTTHRIAWTLGLLDDPATRHARTAEMAAIDHLIAQIPPNARVATDYRMVARLSGRPVLYVYQAEFDPNLTDRSGAPRTHQEPSRDGQGLSGTSGARAFSQESEPRTTPGLRDVDWMLILETHTDWIERLEESPNWAMVDQGGTYRLYQRIQGEGQRESNG